MGVCGGTVYDRDSVCVKCGKKYNPRGGMTYLGACQNYAAELEPVDNWISVRERCPDVWGVYIVCLKNEAVMEVNYDTVGEPRWFKIGVGDINPSNPVTHWMPLPDPPKK